MAKGKRPSQPLLTDDMPLKGGVRRPRNPDQPALPFDPFPDLVEPCLSVLKQKVPTGPEWLFEIKFDGYRVSAFKQGAKVQVRTKNGHDWTHKFPDIADAVAGLAVETIVIDGEAVVLDAIGRSDFNALQKALGPGNSKAPAANVILYAFDVLYFDGHDLTGLDLEDRRSILEGIVPEQHSAIRFSEEIEADPATIMKHVSALELEGIIAKHRHRSYHSGRSGDWLKIKCVQSETFAVIGYRASGSGISKLLLAGRKNGVWAYAGSVGSGLTERLSAWLRETLGKRVLKTSVAPGAGQAIFTKPEVLVEVKFRGWTSEGKLRHASLKGVRTIEDDAEVFEMGLNGTE
jgi:bifunctional non-homologous end joining protein LigD